MAKVAASFSWSSFVAQFHWPSLLLATLLMTSNYMVFKQYPRIWSITIGYEPEAFQWITSDIARILRLVFNEVSVILLVRGVLRESRYVRFTAYVMLVELFLLMPIYFLIRDVWPIIDTGMIHHFLFNPFIGILLIIAFVHQKYFAVVP